MSDIQFLLLRYSNVQPDTNTFYSKFLPMSTSTPFDNAGLPYDPSLVIINGTFNEEAYKAYSPVYISVTFVVDFMAAFAGITAVLVHTWCKSHY